MGYVVAVVVGMVMGAGLVLIVQALGKQREARIARALLDEAQAEKTQEVSTLLEQVKTSFGALSRDALAANTDLFLKVAADRFDQQTSRHGELLEGNRKLIDARLEDMTRRLGELHRVVEAAEKHGAELQGALTSQSKLPNGSTRRPRACGKPWPIPNVAGNGASAWPKTCSGWRAWSRTSITSSMNAARPARFLITRSCCRTSSG